MCQCVVRPSTTQAASSSLTAHLRPHLLPRCAQAPWAAGRMLTGTPVMLHVRTQQDRRQMHDAQQWCLTCCQEVHEVLRRLVGCQLAFPQHKVPAHVDVWAPVRRLGQHRRRPAVPKWHLRMYSPALQIRTVCRLRCRSEAVLQVESCELGHWPLPCRCNSVLALWKSIRCDALLPARAKRQESKERKEYARGLS